MRYWHHPSCTQPDVRVESGQTTPRCHACGTAPDIAALVANRASISSTPLAPAERPIGELDLWWPRAVPYSHSQSHSQSHPSLSPLALWSSSEGAAKVPDQPDQPDQGGLVVSSDTDGLPEKSTPYAATLRSNEFRLINLPAVEDYDSPVHLTLEVYDLDDCPEYETASYTWAGEDGDNRLCKPVYIGPFWHILLQTKNCWEMLRFARPWRGTRMIWVDAICINQDNIPERSGQVANMGRLYSSCNRAIVYLGPDLAIPMHGVHPRRRRLHELATGTVKPRFADHSETPKTPPPHQLKDLLKRRYFSRIWVIQELLLSQRVSIRVGDVDFWADPAMASYLASNLPDWDWGDTAAAWVQHIAQGTSGINNLQDLLRLTSLSQATDPRDRLFGLLGILRSVGSSSSPGDLSLPLGDLQADYSLSSQHVFIGLFAYCLINLRQPTILHHASGLAAQRANYPTWVPDWTSQETWGQLFSESKVDKQQFYELTQEISVGEDGQLIPPQATSPLDSYDLIGPGQEYVAINRSWCTDAQIQASLGALSINLTQYMSLSAPIHYITDLHDFGLFAMRKKRFTVYFLCKQRLDKLTSGPKASQLFVLNVDNNNFMYLILRRSSNWFNETYHLVATCAHVLLQMPSPRGVNEVPRLRSIRLQDVQYSVFDRLLEVAKILHDLTFGEYEPSFNEYFELSRLFPDVKRGYEILSTLRSLYIVLHSDIDAVSETTRMLAFEKAYASDISSKFSPRVDDDHLIISVATSWRDICALYFQHSLFDRPNATHWWSYRLRGQDAWAMAPIPYQTYKRILESRREQCIEVRLSMSRALFVLALAPGVKRLMNGVKNIIKLTGLKDSQVWDLLEEMERKNRHPRAAPSQPSQYTDASKVDVSTFSGSVQEQFEKSHYTGCINDKHITPDITFHHLRDDLGMDGSTTRITIE